MEEKKSYLEGREGVFSTLVDKFRTLLRFPKQTLAGKQTLNISNAKYPITLNLANPVPNVKRPMKECAPFAPSQYDDRREKVLKNLNICR
jgi:hypothetical protein